jgi:hypothetical protein
MTYVADGLMMAARADNTPLGGTMNITCADETAVSTVKAVLLKYEVAQVRRQGPNFGNPMISVMVHVGIGEDKERAMRREVAQIAGATICS